MIGRLEKTVIDCPDPRALAEFYARTLGMTINEDIGDWVVIGSGPGSRELAFQRADAGVPPRWPGPAYPQQMHLDIRVTDADRAEQELIAIGATRVPSERETGFRVFADPVGHPFALSLVPRTVSSPKPLRNVSGALTREFAASKRRRGRLEHRSGHTAWSAFALWR